MIAATVFFGTAHAQGEVKYSFRLGVGMLPCEKEDRPDVNLAVPSAVTPLPPTASAPGIFAGLLCGRRPFIEQVEGVFAKVVGERSGDPPPLVLRTISGNPEERLPDGVEGGAHPLPLS
jgi:hypothetical protein